jgi:hypothetical protein
METNQDDPDSTNELNAPREPDEAKAGACPAADDDPDQTIEEPGYGHGV